MIDQKLLGTNLGVISLSLRPWNKKKEQVS